MPAQSAIDAPPHGKPQGDFPSLGRPCGWNGRRLSLGPAGRLQRAWEVYAVVMAGPEETAALPSAAAPVSWPGSPACSTSRPDRGRLPMRTGEAGMGKMLPAEGALGEWLAASSGLLRLPEGK